jgi:hypothetical protein
MCSIRMRQESELVGAFGGVQAVAICKVVVSDQLRSNLLLRVHSLINTEDLHEGSMTYLRFLVASRGPCEH